MSDGTNCQKLESKAVRVVQRLKSIWATKIPTQPPVSFSWSSYRCDGGNTGFSKSSAPNTNQTAWIKTGVGGAEGTAPAVADGKVFVFTNSNIIGLDANTGDVVWTYSVSGANPPIVADGYVVFSQPNTTYAIRNNPSPIIPEFPAWTPMVLMFVVLVAAVAIYNQKPSKTQIRANAKN
jgi:outer membrane protein assembly factor BamB